MSTTINFKYIYYISTNMPQVNIDDDAYRILIRERDGLKERGIRASLSDAVRSLKGGEYIVDHRCD